MPNKNGHIRSASEIGGEIASNGNVRFKAASEPFDMSTTKLSYGWANTLIEAATPKDSIINPPLVDYDFHRVLTSIGRRTLYSLARSMYWSIPPLQAAINEQANIASSPFIPRHAGKNTAWGENAFDWLQESFHPVMCLEGWNYDYDAYCEIVVGNSIVDGEIHTLLTEDGSGNARTQFIPAHRVGSRFLTGQTCKITLDGTRLFIDDILIDATLPYSYSTTVEWMAPVVDGVIIDSQMRPIAYRIYEDPISSGTWRDISARSCFPSFCPMVAGQLHGISLLASSAFDWKNWREWKSFEQLAQKAFSSQTIVETNETGEADEAKNIVTGAATFNSDGSKSGLDVQQIQGGTYRYIKAKSGGNLQAFSFGDRPGRSPQDFQEMTLRDAMKGTEWDSFFSLDPKSVGGAPMRVIVDRINRVITKRRRMLKKSVYRVHVYAIAKAIKNGDLPFDPEWYKWTYQGAPPLTADRRYDSQVDEMEYERGWLTDEDIAARRSMDSKRQKDKREQETDDLYTRAERIVKKHPDVSLQEAANRLSLMGSSSFAMARRDTGADALADDPNNPTSAPGKKAPPQQQQQNQDSKAESPGAPITLNIENRPGAAKRKLRFNRDTRGVLIGAEIDES